MSADRRTTMALMLKIHTIRAGARSAASGSSIGYDGPADELVVVGTWHNQSDTASGREGERSLGHRRRPVTRSQSSSSAATPSGAKQSAAWAATVSQRGNANARLFITAHAPTDSSAQRRATPAIGVCQPDGAPAPAGTRLKVILYPLPRPGRGYLALHSPVLPDREAAGDAGASAASRASTVGQTGARGGAPAAAGGSSAAGTGAVSGQQPDCGSATASGEAPAQQSPLADVIRRMNSAAYALAAPHGEPQAAGLHSRSRCVCIAVAVLCSAAAGAGVSKELQPRAKHAAPRQGLRRHALRSSALLAEVSRRGACLRQGALLVSIAALALSGLHNDPDVALPRSTLEGLRPL